MSRRTWWLLLAVALVGFIVAMFGVSTGSLRLIVIGAFAIVLVIAEVIGQLHATKPEPRGHIVHLPHATAPDTFEPKAYHDAIQKALGRMRGDQ